MKRLLLTPLLIIAVTCLAASCNMDCDCTQIVVSYDASGELVDKVISDIRDDCGKQENYTEQDSLGRKEVAIICDVW